MIRLAGKRGKGKVQKSGQNRVGVWSNDDQSGREAGAVVAFPLTWGNFFCNRAGCSLDALPLYRPVGSVESARISEPGTARPTKDSPVPAGLPGTFFRYVMRQDERGIFSMTRYRGQPDARQQGSEPSAVSWEGSLRMRAGSGFPQAAGRLFLPAHAWLQKIGGRDAPYTRGQHERWAAVIT